MTLTKEMIPRISPYSVGDERTDKVMTSEDFAWYKSLAEQRVTKEVPTSVETVTRDLLSAYLVCHLKTQAVTGDSGDMQSESIGGYSYSRKGDIAAGSSYYEQLYLSTIRTMGKKEVSQQIDRTDAILPADFMLDDSTANTYDDGVVDFTGEI